jgi:hypothetical protein
LQESALEEFLFGSGAAVGKLLAKPEDEGADIADLVRQVGSLLLLLLLLLLWHKLCMSLQCLHQPVMLCSNCGFAMQGASF